MRKDDVDFHSDRGPRVPAVNVKVRDLWRIEKFVPQIQEEQPEHEPPFTWEWVEEHVSEDALMDWFGFACESGWEMLQQDAEDIFGSHVKVYSQGRQGGWAVVEGLKDFDYWDAVDLAKWAKFARFARAEADDIPRAMLELIYINRFDRWVADQIEEAGLHRDPIPS